MTAKAKPDETVVEGTATEDAEDFKPTPGLPVDRFRDAVPYLRRPFTPAAVKFKVQSTWETGGLIVAYIDARLVVERLNLVVPHLWSDAYRPVSNGQMWCDLTVDGITRSDVGEGTGKGLVSDALKRAAVRFGIGVSLYATPSLILDNKHLRRKKGAQKETVTINDEGSRFVRATYETWLQEHGVASFGEPFDHGDVDGAQGDPEADAATAQAAGAILPPPLTDKRALDLVAEIRRLYKEEVRALDPMALPPGQFQVKLERARHEHEALEELLAFVKALRDHLKTRATDGAEKPVRTPEAGGAK